MFLSNTKPVYRIWLLYLSGILLFISAGNLHANQGKVIPGTFSAAFVGIDLVTGELILEGTRTGPLPGHLLIRAAVINQTGIVMHIAARWSLTTPWGETVNGENTALLNTESLHFREHGVIVDATGSLAEHIGNFIVIHGKFNNLSFIPGLMIVNGSVTIAPSQAN